MHTLSVPLDTCDHSMALCVYHCHTPTPQVEHRWRLVGICDSGLTNSPPIGTILWCKSVTILYRDLKKINNKILGQMLQPWGQIMLTNRYKSLPIARPGANGD